MATENDGDNPPTGDDETEPFDPHEAIYQLNLVFDEIMMAWPRTEGLERMIEWLETKLGMTKVEAKRWLARRAEGGA